MASIKLDNVVKKYGEVVALDGTSLDIADGEFFVVLGPSGAGKTTMLKTIAGLVDIKSGKVEIGGFDMDGVQPYTRNVAMAFESYALYPQDTVENNLLSPLKSGRHAQYERKDMDERVAKVTKTLGIDQLLKRFPRELSNGQRQRVALGRVLVRPAEAYLLDEPLSHLDAKLRATMRGELREIGKMSNTTIVYVTHDYQEAVALADRIAVLRKGKVVQIGTPAEIWNTPVDTFVAHAVGQPEMNLVKAEITADGVRISGMSNAIPLRQNWDIKLGAKVLLGIRPRDIKVVSAEDSPVLFSAEGKVTLAERIGRSVELLVDFGKESLIVVSDAVNLLDLGKTITLDINPDLIHLFEFGEKGETTLRIPLRQSNEQVSEELG